MPDYVKPNDQWLAGTLGKQAKGLSAVSAQGTDYICDSAGKCWAIIGNLSADNKGTPTGIGSATAPLWGLASFASGSWLQVGTGPVYGRVTADIPAGGSMANATGLSFAISPGDVWSFDVPLYVTAVGGPILSFQITGPSSPAGVLLMVTQDGTQGSAATAFSSPAASGGPASTTDVMRLAGTIVNGSNAGTVQVQFDFSGGTSATLKAGSYLTAFKGI